MKIKLMVLATVIGLSLGGSGRASTLDKDVATMDRMIRKAGAVDVFRNETTKEGDFVARHVPSGMKCHFFLGLGRLIYDSASSDAACLLPRSTYMLSLAALPAAGNTEGSILASAVADAAKGKSTRDTVSALDANLKSDPKLPHITSRRFEAGGNYWYVSVARSGDWFVLMQAVSKIGGNVMGEAQQNLEWREVLAGLKSP